MFNWFENNRKHALMVIICLSVYPSHFGNINHLSHMIKMNSKELKNKEMKEFERNTDYSEQG